MGRHRLNFKPFGLKFKEELNFRMKVLQLLLLVGIVSCFPGRYSRYYPRYGYRTYSYGGYRKPFTAFNSAQKERIAARTGVSAQNSAFFRLGNVNVDKYVNEALSTPLLQDSRVKASNDLTSPTAAAALAYMKSSMERAKKKQTLRLQEHILRLTTEGKDFLKEVLALQRMLLGERQPEVEVILSLKHLLPLSMK